MRAHASVGHGTQLQLLGLRKRAVAPYGYCSRFRYIHVYTPLIVSMVRVIGKVGLDGLGFSLCVLRKWWAAYGTDSRAAP